ncbi:hypothetical protein IC582_027487 [Cucumis melo]
MLNLTSSLFSTFFHRNITSKPFFQKSLNNQKLPSFTTSNHFQLLFNLLDSDGDGKISTKELSQFLYRLGYKKLKPTMEAEEMVKEMDSDRDGFIEMDEFLEVLQKGEEEEEILREAFLIFDGDKNGLICAEELKRTFRKFGWTKCDLKQCKKMIEGVDHDGDGFVNFQDFRLMMTQKR